MQDMIDATALKQELSSTEEVLLEAAEETVEYFRSYGEDLEIYESATGGKFPFEIFTRKEWEILAAAVKQIDNIAGAARERLLK